MLSMSNPFLVPSSATAERDRKHRQKFKMAVSLLLVAATCFLMGMLVQACNDQHRGTDRAEAGGLELTPE